MKHSLHIISFSAPWFQVSLDTGPADQMVHLHAMPSKWRLKFRSTGHRTTEADCEWKWSIQLGRPGAGKSCCALGPKGQLDAGLLQPPALSVWLLTRSFIFWGRWFWEVRDKRGEEEGKENQFAKHSQPAVLRKG